MKRLIIALCILPIMAMGQTMYVNDPMDKRFLSYVDSLEKYAKYQLDKERFVADMKRCKTSYQLFQVYLKWENTWFDYVSKDKKGRKTTVTNEVALNDASVPKGQYLLAQLFIYENDKKRWMLRDVLCYDPDLIPKVKVVYKYHGKSIRDTTSKSINYIVIIDRASGKQDTVKTMQSITLTTTKK